MTTESEPCLLCSPAQAARVFGRRIVWQDSLWRLSMIVESSPVIGFAHLETVRHVPYLTDLEGEEAATLGPTLARVTSTLKFVTGAELVYVYVFGERVAHLHFNLAPHRDGDALAGGPGLLRAGALDVPSAELSATGTERGTRARRRRGLLRNAAHKPTDAVSGRAEGPLSATKRAGASNS